MAALEVDSQDVVRLMLQFLKEHKLLSSMEALRIAEDAVPAAPRSPQIFDEAPDLGTMVLIRADDYGRDPVEGKLIFLDANEVAISREDPQIGEVVVHFPRLGYDLRPLQGAMSP